MWTTAPLHDDIRLDSTRVVHYIFKHIKGKYKMKEMFYAAGSFKGDHSGNYTTENIRNKCSLILHTERNREMRTIDDRSNNRF